MIHSKLQKLQSEGELAEEVSTFGEEIQAHTEHVVTRHIPEES
jgi:hypothetical protein